MGKFTAFAEDGKSICTNKSNHAARCEPGSTIDVYQSPDKTVTVPTYSYIKTEGNVVGGTAKTTIAEAKIWINDGKSFLKDKVAVSQPVPPTSTLGVKSQAYLGPAWPDKKAGSTTVFAEGSPVMCMTNPTLQNTDPSGKIANAPGIVDDADNAEEIRKRIAEKGTQPPGDDDDDDTDDEIQVDDGEEPDDPETPEPTDECGMHTMLIQCSHSVEGKRNILATANRKEVVFGVVADASGDQVTLKAAVNAPCGNHVTWTVTGTPNAPDVPPGLKASLLIPQPELGGMQGNTIEKWLYLRTFEPVHYFVTPTTCAGPELSATILAYPKQTIDASLTELVRDLIQSAIETVADTEWGLKVLDWSASLIIWIEQVIRELDIAFEQIKDAAHGITSWIPGVGSWVAGFRPFLPARQLMAKARSLVNSAAPMPADLKKILDEIPIGLYAEWQEWKDHRAFFYEVVTIDGFDPEEYRYPEIPFAGFFSWVNRTTLTFHGGKAGRMEPGKGFEGLGGHLAGTIKHHTGIGLNCAWSQIKELDWLELEANVTTCIESMVQVVVVNSEDEKLRLYLGPASWLPLNSRGKFKLDVKKLIGWFRKKMDEQDDKGKSEAQKDKEKQAEEQRKKEEEERKKEMSWWERKAEEAIENKEEDIKNKLLALLQKAADKISFEIDNEDFLACRQGYFKRKEFRFF